MGRPRGSKYFSMVNAGDTFGKWTVTGTPWMKKGHPMVECKCECGHKTHARIDRLVKGKSTQCRSCAAGTSPTIGSYFNFTTRSYARAVVKGLKYSLDESHLSESFSIQSNSCALTGEAITVSNSAPVPYIGSKGLTPDNTVLVSKTIKDQMGGLDARTFIGLCQTIVDKSIIPKQMIRKNVSVREFFDKREQQ